MLYAAERWKQVSQSQAKTRKDEEEVQAKEKHTGNTQSCADKQI